jgi:hypothetical protein
LLLLLPSRPRWLALLLPGLFLLAMTRAEMIELPAGADTGILEYEPGFNLGAQADVPAGTLGPTAGGTRSRMLLHFDVASVLPTNVLIQAAYLRLVVTREPLGAASSLFALHQVRTPWSEGDKQGALPGGAAAGPGETTWNERKHGQAAWSEPGGEPGPDFDPVPAATELVQGTGTYEFELSAKGVAGIQDWLRTPSANHGWVLRSQAEQVSKTARRFATRESGKGPVLVLRHGTAPVAPRITGFEIHGPDMILRFWGEAGQGYVWGGATELATPVWNTVALIEPAGAAGSRAATNAWPALPQQHFRLRTGLAP